MHREHLLTFPILLLLSTLSTGCWTVAAGVTGGVILGAGAHVLENTAEDTVAIEVSEAKAITRQVLTESGLLILGVKPTYQNSRITRWDFEAGAVGDTVLMVDVSLAEVSRELTRVTVKADKGWLSPDLPTARAVLARIARSANRASSDSSLKNANHHGG